MDADYATNPRRLCRPGDKETEMEIDEFDGLTRALSGAGSSRRLALRILGGMLLSGTLARVVATQDQVAVAAKKNHRAGPARHGATLHDEGNHRKKKHHKRSQQTQQCSD